MNRSLKLPLLVALALGSSHVLAMDLGQIRVKSALGQPLLAEIPVKKASPAELQHLNVQLASGEEFVRAGVAGGRPTIPLQFNVVDAGNGHKVIRITSSEAVNDPFIDLLIELNGSAGKSVREFTILLDPPGAGSSAASQVAAAPARQASHPATTSTSAAHPVASHATATQAKVANGKYGPITRGQTLSSVAHSTAPAGVDINQMMLALKQANPDAFYRDNINALKTGAVLRVPTKSDAEAMAVAAAAAEVRRENGDWRSGAVRSPTSVADAGTRASTSSSPTATSGSKGDHLSLVPAKGGQSAATAGGEGKGKSASIHQELLRNQETMTSLEQQSNDLKSRLKDLSDINSKNERLLALKDSEIAELQQKLAAARKTAGMPAEAALAATAVAAATHTAAIHAAAAKPEAAHTTPAAASSTHAATVAAASSTATALAKAGSVSAPAKAGSAPAPVASKPAANAVQTMPIKPEHKPVPAPVEEQPWYMQLWAQVLIAIGVVLLLVLALVGRRRKSPPMPKAEKVPPSLADRFAGVPPMGGEGDADIDQNQLLDQLAEHPDDIESHLELVSLYYGRRDVEHFEGAAEAMHAHVVDPQQDEWQEVVRMGKDLAPGHPLFAQHATSAMMDEDEAHHAFDISQYAAKPETPAPAMPPLSSSPVKVSEYNFNFDLTPQHESEPAAHSAETRRVDEEPKVSNARQAPAAESHEEDLKAFHKESFPHDTHSFSDDPIDTKLDLARAYMDMGDPDGARAMLDEVMQEGSQTQRDVARRLLEDLH